MSIRTVSRNSRPFSTKKLDATGSTHYVTPVRVATVTALAPETEPLAEEAELVPVRVEEVPLDRSGRPGGRRFGTLVHATLAVVDLDADGTAVGVVDAGDFWHSDSSHHEIPVKITILQSIRNPQTGGDTEFCDMYRI